jgi:TIR domain
MSTVKWPLNQLPGDGVYSLREAQSSLLQVLLSEFSLSRDGGECFLDVSFKEEDNTIRRREAKSYVQENMPGHPGKIKDVQDRINAVLFGGENHYAHADPDFVFRYASGGTLPIIEIDSSQYYCLFYRDVAPVGWNIANGSSDSLPELLNPKRTIERELREELMIFGLRHNPPVDYVFTWKGQVPVVVPEFEYARVLAKCFLAEELNINTDFRHIPLEVNWDPTGPDTLRVKFGEQDAKVVHGFYLNINAKDFGIELDRIARIRLPEGAVLLDGEINNNQLLNEPVGLFEVRKTQQAVMDGLTEFLPDRLYYGAAKEVDLSSSSAARLREDVILPTFLPRLERLHVRSPEANQVWKDRPLSECFDLCPVTRTIIRRHMQAAKPEIFMSYNRKDQEFAERLKKDLERRGIKVWLDKRDLMLIDPIEDYIKRAIEKSSHMVLLASQHSVAGGFVCAEIEYASKRNKPKIAVTLDACELPSGVGHWRRINFQENYEAALEELANALFLRHDP